MFLGISSSQIARIYNLAQSAEAEQMRSNGTAEEELAFSVFLRDTVTTLDGDLTKHLSEIDAATEKHLKLSLQTK